MCKVNHLKIREGPSILTHFYLKYAGHFYIANLLHPQLLLNDPYVHNIADTLL